MELLQGVQYFYSQNGQQIGPVDGTQLVALAEAGQVTEADHIWAEGFTDWVPVTSVDQLAPLFQSQAPAAEAVPPAPTGYHPKPSAAAAAPDTVGGQHVVKRKIDIKPKQRYLQKSSFGRLILLLCLMGGSLTAISVTESVAETMPNPPEFLTSGTADIILAVVFILSLVIYNLLSLIYLWRAWYYIQELPVARTTPGKAVGFLFIPVFNVFWVFVAYVGWAVDYNKYLDMAQPELAPRASPGLAIAGCLFPLLHPIVMWEICRGTNYIATSPKPEVP